MMINQIKKELEALEVQMIEAINLLWIVPLCISIGMVIMAFFCATGTRNKEFEAYESGFHDGYSKAKEESDKNG